MDNFILNYKYTVSKFHPPTQPKNRGKLSKHRDNSLKINHLVAKHIENEE
jgi:hypothetical protein